MTAPNRQVFPSNGYLFYIFSQNSFFIRYFPIFCRVYPYRTGGSHPPPARALQRSRSRKTFCRPSPSIRQTGSGPSPKRNRRYLMMKKALLPALLALLFLTACGAPAAQEPTAPPSGQEVPATLESLVARTIPAISPRRPSYRWKTAWKRRRRWSTSPSPMTLR